MVLESRKSRKKYVEIEAARGINDGNIGDMNF